MLPYSYIYNASLGQLMRWWEGVDPLPVDFDEDGIVEVACALSAHPSEGVAVLKRYLDAGDQLRRRSALYSLAWPEVADEEVRSALLRAFYSEEREIRYTALWGFIHLSHYPLTRDTLTPLLDGEDQLMAALIMVYLSHACSEDAVSILREALKSQNPRMREFACDEIGDRDIGELKSEMRLLLADKDVSVAQAAASNL
jgi:HEAT repeat protein